MLASKSRMIPNHYRAPIFYMLFFLNMWWWSIFVEFYMIMECHENWVEQYTLGTFSKLNFLTCLEWGLIFKTFIWWLRNILFYHVCKWFHDIIPHSKTFKCTNGIFKWIGVLRVNSYIFPTFVESDWFWKTLVYFLFQ